MFVRRSFCLPCFISAVGVFLLALAGIWLIYDRSGKREPQVSDETGAAQEDVIRYGKELIREQQGAGADLASGPCLDNADAFPGWVIDIAHNPREALDNDPRNQCSAYPNRAGHFIELDPDGNLIRVK